MRVKFQRQIVGRDLNFDRGEEADLPSDLAQKLIDSGTAVSREPLETNPEGRRTAVVGADRETRKRAR